MNPIHATVELVSGQREPQDMRTGSRDISSCSTSEGDLAWSRLKQLQFDSVCAAQERIITIARENHSHVAFDILRTKILTLMRANNWTSLAITSPTAGCGKTVLALNLAFSFAALAECRTILMDLDLRQPRVAKILGTEDSPLMEDFLEGGVSAEQMFMRVGENLAIGASRQPVSDAAELLHRPNTHSRIGELKTSLEPKLIIVDLPPVLVSDDVLAFIRSVDCAILVVAAEESAVDEIDASERVLQQETNLLGIVLNKCRYDPAKYGY
jgi:protein-tyrosine kinase